MISGTTALFEEFLEVSFVVVKKLPKTVANDINGICNFHCLYINMEKIKLYPQVSSKGNTIKYLKGVTT